jgi:hypothetical protein
MYRIKGCEVIALAALFIYRYLAKVVKNSIFVAFLLTITCGVLVSNLTAISAGKSDDSLVFRLVGFA